ncbi:MAG: histidinol dehydrogenase [Candidatus Bathyarchaeota archaeon]|nr:histidinol dehydrogenase [Candidatus Bathyarchaeota archaeon]
MPNKPCINVWKTPNLPADWFKRKNPVEKDNASLEAKIRHIISQVRLNGDAALFEFTEKFDKVQLTEQTLQVTQKEIENAYRKVKQEQIAALKLMKDRLASREKHALRQIPIQTSCEGITVQTVLRPLESVGCYVPGGRAVYPSTVVMTALPAKIAGVKRVVVCSPPTEQGTINPLILVASDICGVEEIYKVGGAQAIAAMAYGTKTIKAVKKIVGPGSTYVTIAKILVSQDVAIDVPAGPSEVLVLADETANPQIVAADMISQAEHGADSIAGLITTSKRFAQAVAAALEELSVSTARADIVKAALSTYSFIIVCQTVEEMVELANVFAPEHLEIITRDAQKIAEKITSAGVILVGPYSPVALSDYASGTNHVLPTAGFGHSFSGLSVLDFLRRVNIVESTKDGLQKVKESIKVLTDTENLPNHYRAVEARFKE